MIVYLVCAAHRYTIDDYLHHWGQALAPRFAVLPYEELATVPALPGGAYVFTDLERLTPAQAGLAAQVWEQLERAGPGFRLLNHPLRALRRYDLLRALYQGGRNRFDVCRATEARRPPCYPVFIRLENDHAGSRSALLHQSADVDRGLVLAALHGHDPHNVLIVEHCDTADPHGIYRKYSAVRLGDRLVPRHVLFSRNWVVKNPDLADAPFAAEQESYLETNPHARQLWETFQLAHIEFGRIDYSLRDGQIQVWEINTNAHLLPPPVFYKEAALRPAQARFAEQVAPAFAALDADLPPRPAVHIALRPESRGGP